MPQNGIINKPHDELLTFEEIARAVKIFSSLGVSKIRLTGGEPLVRKGIVNLIDSLNKIKGIEEISLTTNGELLSFYTEDLKMAGLDRINISLDTLRENRFKNITRRSSLCKVFEGIDSAREVKFNSLKLNMVVMKGINDDEIIDFADFAFSNGLILRFIEFMNVTPLWRRDHFIPIEEVKKICKKRFRLKKIGSTGPGPAIYYKVEGGGILGFINTSLDNCRRCNRLRLTSTGELKVCLYEPNSLFLKNLLRSNVCDEEITDIIKARLEAKETINYQCLGSDKACYKVYMSNVGG